MCQRAYCPIERLQKEKKQKKNYKLVMSSMH